MKVFLAVFFSCALFIGQAQKKVTIQKSGESDLFLIKTQKGFSTLIQFSDSDEIEEVTCGDKEFWVIEGKGRYLHVKPAKEGIVTNLNVLLKGDVVYSFLLKEISSKAGNSKEKPDLKVVVGGGDELSKLRKDKENLEEALARSERNVADRTAKGEGEKKEAQKKSEEEGVIQKKEEQLPKTDPILIEAKPVAEVKSAASASPLPPADPKPAPAAAVPAPVAAEKPLVTTYVIERHDGLLRTGGRFIGRFFRKVGRTLRLY